MDFHFYADRVKQDFKANDEGVWAALIDMCHNNIKKSWSVEDITNNARFVYGEVVELALLLGLYHSQVGNGGHEQYFINGYSGSTTRGEDDFHTPLTRRMRDLMMTFKLHEQLVGRQIHEILVNFITITPNLALAEIDHPDEDDEDAHDERAAEYDKLDDQYYAISDQWVKLLDDYFGQWLEHGRDPNQVI